MKYTLILILAMVFATFVSHAQSDTKKVVIIKKVKDENGKIQTEEIEATGAEADKLLQKIKQDNELEGIDLELEIEKAGQDGKAISKSVTEDIQIEKTIVDGKETTSYTITTTDNGVKEVMVWNGEGEMPEEMAAKVEKHKMREVKGEGHEMIFIAEGDDTDTEMTFTLSNNNKVTLGVMINDDRGVTIDQIVDDSPATKAGLMKNDLILKIDGQYIFNLNMLLSSLSHYDKGDTCEIVIIRDGEEVTKKVQF